MRSCYFPASSLWLKLCRKFRNLQSASKRSLFFHQNKELWRTRWTTCGSVTELRSGWLCSWFPAVVRAVRLTSDQLPHFTQSSQDLFLHVDADLAESWRCVHWQCLWWTYGCFGTWVVVRSWTQITWQDWPVRMFPCWIRVCRCWFSTKRDLSFSPKTFVNSSAFSFKTLKRRTCLSVPLSNRRAAEFTSRSL